MSEKLYMNTLRKAGFLELFTINALTFEGKLNSKKGTMSVYDIENISFKENDVIERSIINDLKEYYVIKEVNFSRGHPGHLPASWDLSIIKQGQETKAVKIPNVQQTFITTVHGDIKGGQMIGTKSSTQSNIYTEIENDISKLLENLLKMIQDSKLDDIEKDDAEEIVTRLNKFSKVEDKSTIFTRTKERLESLKTLLNTGIKTGKLIPEVLSVFDKVQGFFN